MLMVYVTYNTTEKASGYYEHQLVALYSDHVLVGRLSGIFCCCSLLLRSLQRYTRASNSLRFSKRAKGLVRKFKNRRMDVSQECSDTLSSCEYV